MLTQPPHNVPTYVPSGGDAFSGLIAAVQSDVSPTYGAMSMRRVVPAYSGPLVRLRRSTDSVQSDFSAAAGSDLLDVAAITAWLGAATGFVMRVYDQLPTGRYVDQVTTTAQPTLTISGADAWVTFASGKSLSLASMLDFAQYRDSVAIGLVGRVPGTPDAVHNLVGVSRGVGANSNRAGILVDVTNRLRLSADTFDDVNGYTGAGFEVAAGTDWWSSIGRIDFRTGTSRMKVGATESIYLMPECVKSDKTLSTGGKLNGHTTDLGLIWNFHTLILANVPNPNVAIPPSTIWLVGDSQVAGNTIILNSPWQATTYADRAGAVMANRYESDTGVYRYVHQKGTSGATSTSVRTSYISTIVPQMDADDVLYIQVGQNDARANSTDWQVTIDNITAMIAASPTTKIVVGTMSYWQAETTGTAAFNNKKAVNDLIMSTFPTYAWDMASMLASYGGNTDGRTPNALLWKTSATTFDAGHRGVLGTQVEYSIGHDAEPGLYGVIAARGY